MRIMVNNNGSKTVEAKLTVAPEKEGDQPTTAVQEIQAGGSAQLEATSILFEEKV